MVIRHFCWFWKDHPLAWELVGVDKAAGIVGVVLWVVLRRSHAKWAACWSRVVEDILEPLRVVVLDVLPHVCGVGVGSHEGAQAADIVAVVYHAEVSPHAGCPSCQAPPHVHSSNTTHCTNTTAHCTNTTTTTHCTNTTTHPSTGDLAHSSTTHNLAHPSTQGWTTSHVNRVLGEGGVGVYTLVIHNYTSLEHLCSEAGVCGHVITYTTVTNAFTKLYRPSLVPSFY